MKIRAWLGWLLLGVLLPLEIPATVEDSLSIIRKINHYYSLEQTEAVMRQLEQLDTSADNHTRKRFVAKILEGYGDYYRREGKPLLAERFFRQALQVNASEWKTFNKLNELYVLEHKTPLHLPTVFRQVPQLWRNFPSAYLLLNRTLNSLFIAICWVFMVLALVLLFRYFPLAQTDLFRDGEWRINWIQLVAVMLLLLWPLVAGPGWGTIPFLILGFLWVYLERSEKRSILAGMLVFTLVVLLAGFQIVLDRSLNSKEFGTAMKVFSGKSLEAKEVAGLDPQMVVMRAFNEYEAGNLESALDLLESSGEEFRGKLKYQLLAGIQYRFGNITESIANLRLALQMDDKDPVSLNNFTLVLLENGNRKLLDSYIQRYPEIKKLQSQYLQLEEPMPDPLFLWRRLFSRGRPQVSIAAFLKNWGNAVVESFATWSLLLFLLYLLLIPKVFSGIGKSVRCSKCGKHIDRTAVHRSYKLCNECYQLFMIKDVMFLEAKVIKEKELMRRRRYEKALTLSLSLFVPGLNLIARSRHTAYILLATSVYFLMAFFWTTRYAFKETFAAVPLFLQLVGVAAILVYVVINLVAVKGEEDGL